MTARLPMAAAVGLTTVAALVRLDIPAARAFYRDYLQLP